MVEDDGAAREVGVPGQHDPAHVGGGHRRALCGAEIRPAVRAARLAVEHASAPEGAGGAPRDGALPGPTPEPLLGRGREDRPLLLRLAGDPLAHFGWWLDIPRRHRQLASLIRLMLNRHSVDTLEGGAVRRRGGYDAQRDVVAPWLHQQIDADKPLPDSISRLVEANGPLERGGTDLPQRSGRLDPEQDRLARKQTTGPV